MPSGWFAPFRDGEHAQVVVGVGGGEEDFVDLCRAGAVAVPPGDEVAFLLWAAMCIRDSCEFRCPASIPTQLRYNLLRAGKVEEAYKLVFDYTPFPGSVCGGVCPNPCMEGCTRGGIDEAVQIGALGRCSIDVSLPRPTGPTGKKVAVIGGGVAGLSAAWRLARKGHEAVSYTHLDVYKRQV